MPAFERPSDLNATKPVMDILGDGGDGGTNKNERLRRSRWMV